MVGAGAVSGLVKDIYGDGIPECNIILTNKTIGFRRAVMTSDDGIFDAPGIIPASNYDLKVTRRGYADWELPSFDVAVGESVNFKITLYADKASTPTDALRALPAVQDTKTSLTALVTNTQLNTLPSRDRLLDNLVLLAPGVTESPDGTLIFRGEPWSNATSYDGIDITNLYFFHHPNLAPFVTQESVEQMQVISAAAPAEFGRSSGGFMNMITKMGINSLHASAYDYYSQNSWDAPDFFGNGFVPTGRQNQAGISAGLPIATDSLFLYGNLERVNDSSQGLNHITNPLFTNAAGTAVSATGCTATAAQCATAASFIQSEMNVTVPMTRSSTTGFARLDFRPGDSNSFTIASAIYSGRGINGLNNATVAPNGGLYTGNADTTNSTRYATFGWTHVVNGSAVNEFHGDWFRDSFTASTNPVQYNAGGVASPIGANAAVAITVAGTPLGGNPELPINLREQRYGGTDIFTLTEANHTIRLGVDIWRNQDTMDQLYARYGMFDYASFSNFATDFSANVKQLKDYAIFTQNLGTSLTSLYSMSFHAHAQDTWRIMPGLVLTAGLRWEKERLPQPTQPNPSNYQSEFIPSPNTNFSPRIGIAYLLDKRTVIRVGGGTYYQPFSGEFIRDLFSGGGVFQPHYELIPTAVGAPAFPKPLLSTAPSTLASSYVTQFYTASRFRNPYTIQGSAAIERRLNRWVSLAASYIQSQGDKMFTATDQNLPGGSTVNESYTIDNAQGVSSGTYPTLVWNPAFAAHRYQVDTEGSSRYRGATAQARTAPIFGLSVQASYTWSHATDDFSGPPAYSIISANTFPGAYAGDRGNAQFDQRNRGVVNWNWQPVFSKGKDALSRFVLNGWLISGIGTYESSMYATPTVQVIGQQFTGVTMLYTTSLNATDGWSRVPFQPIGTLPIGTHQNIDVRISKALPFTERFQGRLMFQAYNVANHANYSAVNTIGYTAVSGVLKPVTGVGLPIASYGYPFGTTARHLEVVFRLDF